MLRIGKKFKTQQSDKNTQSDSFQGCREGYGLQKTKVVSNPKSEEGKGWVGKRKR